MASRSLTASYDSTEGLASNTSNSSPDWRLVHARTRQLGLTLNRGQQPASSWPSPRANALQPHLQPPAAQGSMTIQPEAGPRDHSCDLMLAIALSHGISTFAPNSPQKYKQESREQKSSPPSPHSMAGGMQEDSQLSWPREQHKPNNSKQRLTL
jgi:hypothetical protein